MNVSVLIPCFNSGKWLESTVRSAANQTLPPVEIICVDDGSENDAAVRLQRLRDETGDSLRILRQPERRGIGAARNRGLHEARGEWIALLDHDDLWLPEKLETQARLANRSPNAALLHSRCWEQQGDDTTTRSLMHEWKRLADTQPFPFLFLSNFIVPCTVLLRREIVINAGGFDERLDRQGKDDIELWLRLAAAGHNLAHDEQPLAVRRLHGDNYSADTQSFLQGRYDVLLEAFERNLAGAQDLLVSEGVIRLFGVVFELLTMAIRENRADDVDMSWNVLQHALERSNEWNGHLKVSEKMVFNFPAFSPLASLFSKKNRKPALHHVLECASAARDALAHASYLVAARRDGTTTDSAFHEMLARANETTNQAARRAFRRRAEFADRHREPLIRAS